MAEPTAKVRAATYDRDGGCVTCGTKTGREYQHRAVEGQGGRKARPSLVEGLTSCRTHNPRYEDSLQTLALVRGWKVRTWVRDQGLCGAVPVFYVADAMWFQLLEDGGRVAISPAAAADAMRDVYGDEWDRWVSEVAA